MVRIISPLPLSQEQKEIIKKYLSRLSTSGSFTFQQEVDPSLIGGVIIIWGEMLIDCSIKTQLEKIKEQILKEGS